MIYDLSKRIRSLSGSSIEEKMRYGNKILPNVGLVAFNGIPFIGDPPTYFGMPASYELLNSQIKLGLGFGGALTFLSKISLDELSEKSLFLDHDWTMHSISATICFADAPTFVEMSFSRDSNFHMSWVESKKKIDWNVNRIFTASASLKTWKKYTKNRNNKDFANIQRYWLDLTFQEISKVFPQYFVC